MVYLLKMVIYHGYVKLPESRVSSEKIWVCLKIVYPFLPNDFHDHYPY